MHTTKTWSMIQSRTPRMVILAAALVAIGAAPAAATDTGTSSIWGGHDHLGCCGFKLEAVLGDAAAAGFDPETGRDLRNFPKDRLVEYRHMRLEVVIPDMNVPTFRGVQTLTFEPLGRDLVTLRLDAKELAIDDVALEGHTTRFTHDGEVLEITFDPPVPKGSAVNLVTTYRIDDPPLGLIWTPEHPAWPGRAAQIHTQGQPETNSFWFPAHDFPNDRLTTELIVTAPAGYEVSGNGRLVSRDRLVEPVDRPGGRRDLKPMERWHWLQDGPHPNYLVSLIVGKFDIVDVGGEVARGRRLSMPVYVPPGRGGDVQGTYGNTMEMVRVFERLLDEPYPWARYGQLVVWNFGSGGMENTSVTTMYDTAIFDAAARKDHDLDALISHELAHQWFGDLITCNSWEHIWLNEGFATYLESLWFEHRDGAMKGTPAKGREAYLIDVLANADAVVGNDRTPAPEGVGMASRVYVEPFEAFRRPANPYTKGATILHMLRTKLGDERFFRALQVYVDRFKFKQVETNDFRRVLEEVSGENLEQFFRQWTTRPAIPELDVATSFDAAGGSLSVQVTQKQLIDGDNPAFEFDLPVWVAMSDGSIRREVVQVRGRTGSASFAIGAEPLYVAVDPELAVLSAMTVSQPATAAMVQARQGPTIVAQIRALRQLAGDRTTTITEQLRRMATDTNQPVRVRAEVMATLAARGDHADVRSLLTTAADAWELRVASNEAAAAVLLSQEKQGTEGLRVWVEDQLARRAQNDPSQRVRASAISQLGRINAQEYASVVMAALKVDSQNDGIRQAALNALAELEPEGALEAALALTREGVLSRTRGTATEVVGRLASQNEDAAVTRLIELLDDRVLRVRRAAGNALAGMDDPRALEALRARRENAISGEVRRELDRWIRRAEEKAGTPAAR